MLIEGGERVERDCTVIIKGLYPHKINLHLIIAFFPKIEVTCIGILFFDLRDWLIINLIYPFFFGILIDVLRLP